MLDFVQESAAVVFENSHASPCLHLRLNPRHAGGCQGGHRPFRQYRPIIQGMGLFPATVPPPLPVSLFPSVFPLEAHLDHPTMLKRCRWCLCRKARLYVCDNGHASPCLDLRRIPDMLADATVGTDLVIIEGMGRSVHTNFNARFKCNSLKLAMIKNQHLADRLFQGQGKMYDCVCKFEPGVGPEAD
jgi:hypothetical protein